MSGRRLLVLSAALVLLFLAVPAIPRPRTAASIRGHDDGRRLRGYHSGALGSRERVQSCNTDSAIGGCGDRTRSRRSGRRHDVRAGNNLTIPTSPATTRTRAGPRVLGSEDDASPRAERAAISTPTEMGRWRSSHDQRPRASHGQRGSVTLDNLRITDGSTTSATGSGRAIWLRLGARPTISKSTVNANHTTEVAGAMRLDASTDIVDSAIHSDTGRRRWRDLDRGRDARRLGQHDHGQRCQWHNRATTGVGASHVRQHSTGSANSGTPPMLGNTANADGGAIYGHGGCDRSRMSPSTATPSDADLGGPFPGNGGGVVGSNVTARNSIVAKNIDASTTGTVDREDCDGTVNSRRGDNLIGELFGLSILREPDHRR